MNMDPQQPDETEAATEAAPALPCPSFSPAMLQRQLAIDGLLHWGVAVAVIVGITLAMMWEAAGRQTRSLVAVLAVAVLWVAISLINARVVQQLPRLIALVHDDPVEAETTIATALHRRPLQRRVRLMLCHRLAMLRHRQQRFAEAAAICHAVLSHKLRRGIMAYLGAPGLDDVRNHLTLMLVEARLHCHDLNGAYVGLVQLHHSRLNLLEALQRLALQTRYEIAAGHPAAALGRIGNKIKMAELMPAPQCGMVHAMLAVAADTVNNTRLADWLRRRAELLCTPEQVGQFYRSAGSFAQLGQPTDLGAASADQLL